MNILTILALILSIGICFFIPLGGLAYFVVKDKKIIKSFFIGIFIFFISQAVIRVPFIAYVLPKTDLYLNMYSNPWVYAIFLALSVGLIEELGRYIGFRYILKNNRTYKDGVAYGLGHGGIEAILITGVSCIVILVGSLLGNDIYMELTPTDAFIAGFERLCAISIQIGLSIIILYGVSKNRIKYLFLAMVIHTLINVPIIVTPKVLKVGIIGIEAYIFIWAVILGGFTIYAKRLYNKQKD